MVRRAHNALRGRAAALRDRSAALRRAWNPPSESAGATQWANDADGPYSGACGCCGAGPYLLAVAAQTAILLQFDVDPSVGGLSGAVSSALRIAPSWAWQSAPAALALLGIGLYALQASKRMLIAWFAVIAIVVLGALTESFDLEDWISPTPELDLMDGLRIAAFLAAPATAVTLFSRIRGRARTAAAVSVGAALAAIVAGWLIANDGVNAFTEEERLYAMRLGNAPGQYPCDFGVRPQGGRLSDFVAGVTDIEILEDSGYSTQMRVNKRWGIPAYAVSLRVSQETVMAARPDYLSACLTGGPSQRDLKRGGNGEAYFAPWRWQRSGDGGASWADVPPSPHRQSAETESYTYRYVPTKADLADADTLLRACVDIRGGGEVCALGVKPRP